jgi:molybdopterin-guanine dinucleotide biosynthesis protein A
VWTEPEDLPRHPLSGIVHALERAGGEDVLCVAADMPLLDAATLMTVATAGDGLRVAAAPDLEPLCAVYPPSVLDALRAAPPGAPLRTTVAALDPLLVAVDREAVVNVNTPEELARAATALDRRTGG